MFTKRYEDALANYKTNNSYRILRETIKTGKNIQYDGNNYINFSSNDYLGISSDTELWNDFLGNNIINDNSFTGSNCSSRLLTGNSEHYTQLEKYLSELYKNSAVVFNSGYHANIGILPALTNKNDLIIYDELVHASIIDGIRLSEAFKIKYRHNNLDQLEDILINERNKYENVFIVSESVFSMDGDIADFYKLLSLKNNLNAFLYIDEAHAIGTYGKSGLGVAEELGLISKIDFLVGTFGKAVASQGAFVICSELFRNYFINKMRSIIFTTALPPFSLKWTYFILQRITNMQEQRAHLNNLGEYFRENISALGYKTNGSSHIVPIIVGENEKCIKLAEYLQENGIFILPIRPPTVPDGTSRLRFSLTSKMELSDIDKIIALLKIF